MANHSSILAWRNSWTEEPGGLQSMGSQRDRHDSATNNKSKILNTSAVIYTQRFKLICEGRMNTSLQGSFPGKVSSFSLVQLQGLSACTLEDLLQPGGFNFIYILMYPEFIYISGCRSLTYMYPLNFSSKQLIDALTSPAVCLRGLPGCIRPILRDSHSKLCFMSRLHLSNQEKKIYGQISC